MAKYEVVILYRGQSSYYVEADNEGQAQEIAMDRYGGAEDSNDFGTDSETIERIFVKPWR